MQLDLKVSLSHCVAIFTSSNGTEYELVLLYIISPMNGFMKSNEKHIRLR